jgi:hypothetical protein
MNIKRYRVDGKHGTDTIIEREDESGEYCRYRDVAAMLAKIDYARLIRLIERLADIAETTICNEEAAWAISVLKAASFADYDPADTRQKHDTKA